MMIVYSTVELAERLKALINKDSFYALAQHLELSPTCVRSWYKLGTTMDDDTGLRVADELKLPYEDVLMSLQIERVTKRGNDRLSQAWGRIASRVMR